MHTTSTAFFDALHEAGVSYVFVNLGSDHPALLEAISYARETGRPIPKIVTSPNEMVALSCAQGYAQVTDQPQAVMVHVECGTQGLAGAIHNVAKSRTPVFIYAGASPFTQEGELTGSRNEFIHWIQDVFDQRGIVRGYVKYNNELRTGRNVKQIVHRAIQIARSEPKGPVYVVGPREIMEEEVPPVTINMDQWRPIGAMALPPDAAQQIAKDMLAARRPLLVTSDVGRSKRGFDELGRLCRRVGMGVLESVPSYLNFSNDDPLYLGNRTSEPHQSPELWDADYVLVVASDVPWVPLRSRPNPEATIVHIDVDPLKEQMPLWYIGSHRCFRADADLALAQINAALDQLKIDDSRVKERTAHYAARHRARDLDLQEKEKIKDDAITVGYLTARIREHLDKDAIVLNEGITAYTAIHDHLRCTRQGSIYRSGGGSLGWGGGAAIGMKLACPDRTVVSLIGDGSFLFSVPSSVFWMARHYKTPFLQVVYNNRGWRAPKSSMLLVHPDGYGSRSQSDDIGVTFDPPPDYAGVAAASGGALALTVHKAQDLDAALAAGLKAVKEEGRCAVLDVWLAKI